MFSQYSWETCLLDWGWERVGAEEGRLGEEEEEESVARMKNE